MLPQVQKRPAAYSYVRMSQETQLKGDSLRRQLLMSKTYAEEAGLSLVDDAVYHDLGVSAYEGKNVVVGALGRFIAAAEAGQIEKGSYLLVESLDRLSRQRTFEAIALLQRILKTGIYVVTLEDKKVLKEEEVNEFDLIQAIVIMMRAHNESHEKSRRIGAAWQKKQANAENQKLTKTCPNWLVLAADRKKFEIVPDRAKIVQRIFKETIEGVGSSLICKGIIHDGIPAWGNAQAGRERQWHESYIKKLLENRAVLGEVSFYTGRGAGRELTHTVTDYYPRIISDEVFERARHARELRRRTGGPRQLKVTNLFSGVAKCGLCFGPMRMRDRGAGQLQYLVCDNASRGIKKLGVACTVKSAPYAVFETSFLQSSVEVGLQSMLIDNELSKRMEVLQARAELSAATESRIRARLVELADALTDQDTPAKTVVSAIAKLELQADQAASETTALRVEMNHMSSTVVATETLDNEFRAALNVMKNLSQEKRVKLRVALQQRIRQVVERLLVYPLGDAVVDLSDLPRYLNEMEAWYRQSGVASAEIARLLAEQKADVERLSAKNEWKYTAHFKSGRKMYVVLDRKDPTRIKRYVDSEAPLEQQEEN